MNRRDVPQQPDANTGDGTMRYQIEVETRRDMFGGQAFVGSVVRGPKWLKTVEFTGCSYISRDKVLDEVRERVTAKFPKHLFELIHSAA